VRDRATAMAWSARLPIIEKLVLLMLAYYTDEKGFVDYDDVAGTVGTRGDTGPIFGHTALLDWVWSVPVKPRQKIVLLAMAGRADRLGLCQVSPMALANMCNLKLATTLAVLGHLADIGLISTDVAGRGYIVLAPVGGG